MTNVHKIPLSIVSGFLGAGKTTFIKKLVREVYSQEKETKAATMFPGIVWVLSRSSS